MPTGCQKTNFSELAKVAGYTWSVRINTMEELTKALHDMDHEKGPLMMEMMVSLESRGDLGRPRESARENKEHFMDFYK